MYQETCATYFYTSIVQDRKALGKPKGPWMSEGIGKVWYIHTMEYHTDMGTKGSQLHATWMNLRKTKLTEKKKTCFKRLNMEEGGGRGVQNGEHM